MSEDNAGKPARRIGPLRAEVIGPPACPIMHRWTLVKVRGRKLLLHHFLPNADDRAEHDHPAPFWTFVLWGGYDDFVPACSASYYPTPGHPDGAPFCVLPLGHAGDHFVRGRGLSERQWVGDGRTETGRAVPGDRMRAGTLRRRAATYRHRTRVLPSGAWTIVWMGRKERPWGFWKDGKWWPWRDYELAFGFGMRCPTEDEP